MTPLLDPEVLALIRRAKGDGAAAEVKVMLAAVETRLEKWHRDPAAFPGRPAWVAELRSMLRRRNELARLAAALQGTEVEADDDAETDRQIIRRLLRDGSPDEFRWLTGHAVNLAAQCEGEVDRAGARVESITDWCRSGAGSLAEYVDEIPAHVQGRRENQDRARRLRAAVEGATARLAELAPFALGELAALRLHLKEAVLLARNDDVELHALQIQLADVECSLGRLGVAKAALSKASKAVGLGRSGSELTDRYEVLTQRFRDREKATIGAASDDASELVSKAAIGNPEALAWLCEWAIRQPAAFAPDLALNIRSAFAESLASDASTFLSVLS
jgi:hypothetical protein